MRSTLRAMMLLGLLPAPVPAQLSPAAPQPTMQVYLITVGQGTQVWEKFGHNALWFVDSASNVDVAYNWGIFDFAQPGFLRRFLTGDTRYWVEGYPGDALIEYYRRSDRDVLLQRLALTPEQTRAAYEYSVWNARPENRYYRYDYFRDNCSTRVRDVIDRALSGALQRGTATTRTDVTYRSESLRLVDDLGMTQAGMGIALGHPADQRLSVWETMFIPMRMSDALRRFRAPSGAPMVAEERVVYRSTSQQERRTPPALFRSYFLVGVAIAALLIVPSLIGRGAERQHDEGRHNRRSSIADRLFRVETIIWAALTGILGTLLLIAWTSTRHEFWYRNENLLLVNPLSLWLGALTILSMRNPKWLRPAAICAVIIAMLGAVALMMKGTPLFRQDNIPVIMLFVPAHFAIAHGLWSRARAAGRS